MSNCCLTCDYRNHAMKTRLPETSQLDVCIIDLSFQRSIIAAHVEQFCALNALLNDIVNDEASTTNSSTFTVWSPCLSDTKTAVIFTTVSEVCGHSTVPLFNDIRQYLTGPPRVRHVYLDRAVLSLAASSPEQCIACDIMEIHAPSSDTAVAIGKMFGWNPKRSSLSTQLQTRASAAFSRPGDLIRDFWAWVELPDIPMHQSSLSTDCQNIQPSSTNPIDTTTDEKNMSLPFQEEDDEPPPYTDDESLMMIFHWNTHADGDRFKDPNQDSYGSNGEKVRKTMWAQQVAHPIRKLQRLGARLEVRRLELRTVEPRLENGCALSSSMPAARARSGSKRLSIMASEISERVSGLWR